MAAAGRRQRQGLTVSHSPKRKRSAVLGLSRPLPACATPRYPPVPPPRNLRTLTRRRSLTWTISPPRAVCSPSLSLPCLHPCLRPPPPPRRGSCRWPSSRRGRRNSRRTRTPRVARPAGLSRSRAGCACTARRTRTPQRRSWCAARGQGAAWTPSPSSTIALWLRPLSAPPRRSWIYCWRCSPSCAWGCPLPRSYTRPRERNLTSNSTSIPPPLLLTRWCPRRVRRVLAAHAADSPASLPPPACSPRAQCTSPSPPPKSPCAGCRSPTPTDPFTRAWTGLRTRTTPGPAGAAPRPSSPRCPGWDWALILWSRSRPPPCAACPAPHRTAAD
mmetsp:Transcript_33649/g.84690  ORF Transcript_33649/g.84690 Transcript_33649/m.84690 type:complete len:330 (-) Transcript_33649:190-1179(-)